MPVYSWGYFEKYYGYFLGTFWKKRVWPWSVLPEWTILSFCDNFYIKVAINLIFELFTKHKFLSKICFGEFLGNLLFQHP